jgi:hypothetical protein
MSFCDVFSFDLECLKTVASITRAKFKPFRLVEERRILFFHLYQCERRPHFV